MSTMLISPNQSPGPSTATRASVLRLLRFNTSTSPLITTNIALASSPSRNSVAPAGGASTVSSVDRYSSTSSLSAPNNPMFLSSVGPIALAEALLIRNGSLLRKTSHVEVEGRPTRTILSNMCQGGGRNTHERYPHTGRRISGGTSAPAHHALCVDHMPVGQHEVERDRGPRPSCLVGRDEHTP